MGWCSRLAQEGRLCGAGGGLGDRLPYPQVVLLFLPLDPVEGLLLGVDAEREAAGAGGEDAILN
jgi:hypothetical protein